MLKLSLLKSFIESKGVYFTIVAMEEKENKFIGGLVGELLEKRAGTALEPIVDVAKEELLRGLLGLVGSLGTVTFIVGGVIIAVGMLCITFKWFKPLKVGAIVSLIGLVLQSISII